MFRDLLLLFHSALLLHLPNINLSLAALDLNPLLIPYPNPTFILVLPFPIEVQERNGGAYQRSVLETTTR